MELSPSNFDYLRAMVLEHSAIVLEPGKEYLIESRLAPVLRSEGIDNYDALVLQLGHSGSSRLRDLVIDAMTTNETSFFRDNHPWQTLAQDLLPPLIESRAGVKRLTFWCAASSSGQEPYSLAMLIHEHFPQVARDWNIRIMGVDLSPTMVTKAQAGRFTQLEVNRGLPATLLMRYFSRTGTDWHVNDNLRNMVEFRVGNLIDESAWGHIPLVDGVFIRNVLIYFNKETRQQILHRAHGRLRSDGFLMLGSSETAVGLDSEYERVQAGKTVVFKPRTETGVTASLKDLLRA